MIATKELHDLNYRCREYPPSILIVGSDDERIQNLKQRLEDNGCDVYYVNARSGDLVAAYQKYFDLTVLDVESPQDRVEVYRQLETKLRLTDTPLVVLMANNDDQQLMNESNAPLPVYHIAKGVAVETKLLQIVEQVHYMTYRYA